MSSANIPSSISCGGVVGIGMLQDGPSRKWLFNMSSVVCKLLYLAAIKDRLKLTPGKDASMNGELCRMNFLKSRRKSRIVRTGVRVW